MIDGAELMVEPSKGSTRDAVRWGLLLAAIAVSGYRLPRVFRNFEEWRASLAVDPSAAALYRTTFMVEAVGITVVVAVGVGIFYLLRPRATKPT
ncbi:MAG: hypothetical protein JWO71_1449 [Candidatus Acidoferrum typicum]|nr:hypothetical protein [Candidatus Acidoferrum typicum]